jgi:hypothetical protein
MLSRLLKKTVQSGPAYASKPFATGERLAFYQRLKRALPNCTLFPDMPLSTLLAPLSTDARHLRQLQDRLAGRQMAYGVYNESLALLCVIELTESGVQDDERAHTLALLEEAQVPCFSWDQGRLPTTDQILRAMSAFTDIAAPRFEAAANSVMRFDDEGEAAAPASLTMDQVLKLTHKGHVRAVYPHIWERVCLFHTEPIHLDHYLGTLSLQDRGSNRNGFPEGVIVELTDLQGANARFIRADAPAKLSWNDCFVNR